MRHGSAQRGRKRHTDQKTEKLQLAVSATQVNVSPYADGYVRTVRWVKPPK